MTMVERVKDVCEKYETLKEECQKLKEKCEKYETLVKDEETSVTQSLSRAMRPCDDVVGLIGEAVLRKREADTLEYWSDLYTGPEHPRPWICWHPGTNEWSAHIVVTDIGGQSLPRSGTIVGATCKDSAGVAVAGTKLYFLGRVATKEAANRLCVPFDARPDHTRSVDERERQLRVLPRGLFNTHRVKWSKLGEDIKWVGLTAADMGVPPLDVVMDPRFPGLIPGPNLHETNYLPSNSYIASFGQLVHTLLIYVLFYYILTFFV